MMALPEIYPGYVIRVYHNLPSTNSQMSELNKLAVKYSTHVELCNIYNITKSELWDLPHVFPMIWRFIPFLDPLVIN